MGANRPFLLFFFLIPILFIFLIPILFFKPTFTISNSIFPLKHNSNSHPFLFPCLPPHHNSHTFCNTSLPITTRAQTLLSLLTLEEKVQQLGNNASAVPRLGIPAYQWWSESLHGLAPNGPGVDFSGDVTAATNFPQVILTTAGFNRTLWFLVGSAIAVEARAMYNAKQAGLTFWAPNINIFRDPRWGRGQETSGEDPMVASAYSIEYVRGFQGGNWRVGGGISEEIGEKRELKDDGGSDDLMLSACCKHFTAYDLEKWGSFNSYNFNAVVTLQDMEDTYQPPFRSCISQGKASCLMCSYNSVNGVPACARKDLLDLARNEWGFKGYVTSDCDAVATVYEFHHYSESPEDAAADVLKAGMDIECGTYLSRHTLEAVKQGKIQEEDIDRALINLFLVHLRLGRFDGDPREGKFGRLGPKDVCTSEHQKLALEAARQGIVLLKNDKKFLPLKKDSYSSLAIIGPLAKNATYLNGDYTGTPCSDKSIFDGLQEYTTRISYAAGCFDAACDSDAGFDEAIRTAKEADFVVVIAGLALSQETEELDRYSLLLPGKQMALLSSVAAASKKPVILVLIGGGSLDVSFAKADPKIAGILWIGYPGEAGAQALAEIIFGDINPSGRLPVTWYPESFVAIPMTDMHMRADPSRGYPGRTYRFYTGSTVYSFGQGLSYTTYSYKFLSAPKRLSLSESSKFRSRRNLPHQVGDGIDYINTDEFTSCASLKFSVEITVMNVGDMDGSHVVMLFSRAGNAIKGSPLKQLVGFNRVYTISNQSSTTSILVDPCKDLSFANEFGKRVLPLGDHLLMLGDLEHSLTIEA